jgi:hypothetical protein
VVSAELLWEKLKARRDGIRHALEDGQGLAAEYLSPTGNVILIRDVGYYTDTDDLIFLVGDDASSGEECQVIALPHAVQIVFRITQEAQRPEIGFHKNRLPKEDKGS